MKLSETNGNKQKNPLGIWFHPLAETLKVKGQAEDVFNMWATASFIAHFARHDKNNRTAMFNAKTLAVRSGQDLTGQKVERLLRDDTQASLMQAIALIEDGLAKHAHEVAGYKGDGLRE